MPLTGFFDRYREYASPEQRRERLAAGQSRYPVQEIRNELMTEAFGDRAGTELGGTIEEYFLPEQQRLQEQVPGLEERFMEFLGGGVDLSGVTEGITGSVTGALGEIFKPGGFYDVSTRLGLDTATQRGLGPTSGAFERSRLGTISSINESIANLVAQQAPALFSTAVQNRLGTLGQFGSFLGLQRGSLEDLRTSLFTGGLSIENLRLIQRQMAQNAAIAERNLALAKEQQKGGGIGGFLGKLAGTALGAFAGPFGASAGGYIGGKLFGGDDDGGGNTTGWP
jgi:hypothetical protein